MALARTTINEVKQLLTRLTTVSGAYAQKKLPTGLNSKPTTESHSRMMIPLCSKKEEMVGYIDAQNNVRIGRLLEDLDMFACWIAYRHNAGQEYPDGSSPLSIVTACVDSVQIYRPQIPTDRDLYMFGMVTWTGSSSMEISMHLTPNNNVDLQNKEDKDVVLDAKFVMVARGHDATGQKAVVYPLKVSTPVEQQLWELGAQNRDRRIQSGKEDLMLTPPTHEESEAIHKMFTANTDQRTGSFNSFKLKEGIILMKNTKLKSCITCSPQHRNVHFKIFGGYLMRKATEIAGANFSLVFHEPSPLCIDVADISFKAPVEIGSLLLLNSQIIATRNRMAICRVHAEVVKPETGETKTTNVFYFIFESLTKTLPIVFPESYGESLMAIDGNRRFQQCLVRHSQLQEKC